MSPSPSQHQALLEAYLATRRDLVRFFAARLRSWEAGEDLVQEMYERVLRVPGDEPIANPSAYLYRLGSNLLLDKMRYDRRRVARETAWSGENSGRPDAIHVADEPAPDEATDARRRLARLITVVDTLPATTRRAFRLHKLEGLTHAETAAAMGVSRSAVEKHISSALKFLLAKLG